MEKSTPLKYFMELANFDQSLNGARYSINSLKSECSSLNKELVDLEKNLESAKQALHAIQKSVHHHELMMKELDLNLQKQKLLLDTVTNQKEHNAVKSAISQIKQEQHNYESILIDEWNKLDQAKIIFENQTGKLALETTRIQDELSQKKLDLEKLELDLANETKQREQFLGHLPNEWLEKYEAMYQKVNNPIVQLLNNACGACYEQATAQVINELKHHKLTQCKGCFRFLFF
jgi:predicted  nucleic acid-binding Zn-ribbon protein